MQITEKQLLKLWNIFNAGLENRSHSGIYSFDERITLQREIVEQQSSDMVETDKKDHKKMKFIADEALKQ